MDTFTRFYYLEDFVKKGIEQKLFTLEEAKEDLNIALWYAYAGNNIDIYEYYYKVINWMPYSEKNAKGSRCMVLSLFSGFDLLQ